jgi:hypothetical protein
MVSRLVSLTSFEVGQRREDHCHGCRRIEIVPYATNVDSSFDSVRTKEPGQVVDVLERHIPLRRVSPEPGDYGDTRDSRLRYLLRRVRIEFAEPADEAVDPKLRLVHQIRSQYSNVGSGEALRANRHVLSLARQRRREHNVLWTVNERILDVVTRIQAVSV